MLVTPCSSKARRPLGLSDITKAPMKFLSTEVHPASER